MWCLGADLQNREFPGACDRMLHVVQHLCSIPASRGTPLNLTCLRHALFSRHKWHSLHEVLHGHCCSVARDVFQQAPAVICSFHWVRQTFSVFVPAVKAIFLWLWASCRPA